MPTSRQDATRFLEGLFTDALAANDALLLATWNLDTRRVAYHREAGQAARRVTKADADGQACYYNVVLLGSRPPHGRGTASNAGCVTALWLDLDVAAPHRQGALPPSKEEAVAFVTAAPLPPTIVVDSGWGIHAYWLLKEPWLLPLPADRDVAARYTKGWFATLGGLAQRRGWQVENLGDLTRILRVPGTTNRKGATEQPVTVLSWDEARAYNPADFDALLPLEGGGAEIPPCPVDVPGTDATPPFDKFQALAANNRKFKRAWEHDRPDLKDGSPSGYDMALTSFAVAAEWTNDEIATLLVAFRRKHGLDTAKVRRVDYLALTIGRARATHDAAEEETTRTQALADVIRAARGIPAEPPPDEAATRERHVTLCADLSKALSIGVVGWLQFGREPRTASYGLKLADGRVVPIDSVNDVLNWRAMRAAIYVSTGHVLRKFTDPQWVAVCRILAAIAEVTEDVEHSELGAFREWLDRYLASQALNEAPLQDNERDDRIIQGLPFLADDEVWINVGHLRAYVRNVVGETTRDRDLARCLRMLGFATQRFQLRRHGRRTRPRY